MNAAVKPLLSDKARSLRAEVRNPVLALPAFRRLRILPQPARDALADVLLDLEADARNRADQCWKKHKAPMAVYWKAIAVYARHIRRALRLEIVG